MQHNKSSRLPGCWSLQGRWHRAAAPPLLAGPLLALAMVAAVVAPRDAAAVSSADEICAPATDPCIIGDTNARKFTVDNGAVLDFGLREVRVMNNNALDFGAGSATLRCGKLVVSGGATQTPFVVRGNDGFGSVSGGFLTIEARRGCSGDAARGCVSHNQCDLGTCSARVCTGAASRACTSDANCNVGTCSTGKRCTGATSIRCTSNADCDLGSCDPSLRCSVQRSELCSSNADCDYGACTLGAGTIDFDGKLAGQGVDAGVIVLRAADDIRIAKAWSLQGTSKESDGGELDVESFFGDVTLAAPVTMTSGGDGDVVVDGSIDANGGDFDGGSVEIDAGQDAIVRASLLASSINGEGGGGFLEVAAGRDARLGADSSTTQLGLKGHSGIDNFGGDGGSLDVFADRDLVMTAAVRLEGNGAAPDGFGSDLLLESGAAMTIDGILQAKADGNLGGGGIVEVLSGTNLTMASGAILTLTGGDSGGGTAEFTAFGDADMGGELDLRSIVIGATAGFGGAASLDVDGTATMRGTWRSGGGVDGGGTANLIVSACDFRALPTSLFDNANPSGGNAVLSGRTLVVDAGARMKARSDGSNVLRYRLAQVAPVVLGEIDPAPLIDVDTRIPSCAVCGDGTREPDEACDDGNTSDGDGCDARCRLETTTTTSTTTTSTSSTTTSTTTTSSTTSTTMASLCGNGNVDEGETCDEGLANVSAAGVWCSAACQAGVCGAPVSRKVSPTATDALFVLRAAVAVEVCDRRLCDTDANGTTSAPDALRVLRRAVGQGGPLLCPTSA